MNLRSFANVLTGWQGGINVKPGKAYKKELTRDEVMEIFGEVPECTVRYGLVISVTLQKNGNYKLTVKRERD